MTPRSMGAGAVAIALFIVASAALAQAPQAVRVSGTVESVNGTTFVLKPANAPDVTVKVADNPQIFGAAPAKIADIKTGDFIAVGAMPQPDGSQKAVQVTIFAETLRGVGEGFRPWDRPGSTMTNATVDTTVSGLDGQVVTVKYKDGDKKIIIGPDAEIRRYIPSDLSELKPGARVTLPRAEKQADGSLLTARIYIGRDGVTP